MKEDWTFQTFLYTEVWATEGVVVMGLATAGMSHWKRKCPHKKKHPTEASHRSPFVICELCTSGKEFYSIVAQDGSGITLANNLFIFVNDVLQRPNIDYVLK